MGVHATIPFYADMVRAKQILINGIDMIIAAEQSTEIQCAVAIALQEILLIATRNGVETRELVNLNTVADELILTARNGVKSHMRVSAGNVERLAMALTAYQTDPEMFIEEVKNAVLENDLVIKTQDGVEIRPTMKIEGHDDLVLTVANGIEISVTKALGQMNDFMELDLSKHIVKIKHLDELQLGSADERKLNHKIEMPFELALEVGIIENDSGVMNLVLYANNDVETILTHPMVIGTIDPKKLGELDPYFVPDSTSD